MGRLLLSFVLSVAILVIGSAANAASWIIEVKNVSITHSGDGYYNYTQPTSGSYVVGGSLGIQLWGDESAMTTMSATMVAQYRIVSSYNKNYSEEVEVDYMYSLGSAWRVFDEYSISQGSQMTLGLGDALANTTADTSDGISYPGKLERTEEGKTTIMSYEWQPIIMSVSAYIDSEEYGSTPPLISSGVTFWLAACGFDPAPTPIPGAIWLLGSGLVGLVGIRCKMKS